MIKCVSFDLWNTLIFNIEYTEPRLRSLQKFLKKQNIKADLSHLQDIYYEVITKYHLSPDISAFSHPSNEKLLKNMFLQIPADFPNIHQIKGLIQEWEDIMLIQPPKLKPGVIELLPKLALQYKIALISDTGITPGKIIERMFAHYNLRQYFDTMVFSDETGLKKPHPKPFQLVQDYCDCIPSEIIHIGDLLHTDILGAKKAGFHTIWFKDEFVDLEYQKNKLKEISPDQEFLTDPDYIVSSHSEIKEIINSIN